MFKLICIGGPHSDHTSSYDVELDKVYTVGEFIDTVLKEIPEEWGYIGIYAPGKVFGHPMCEYSKGKIKESSFEGEFLQLEIKNVRASGGWTRMDYLINIDFDKVEEHHRKAIDEFNRKVEEERRERLRKARIVDISPTVEPLSPPVRKQR